MKLLPWIALLVAAGCQTTQQAKVLEPAEPAQTSASHPFSGMRFPAAVGAFRKGEIKRYDRDGRNMSVAYNLIRLGSAVAGTVYIYPAPIEAAVLPIPKVDEDPEWLLKHHTEQIKNQIIRHHAGAEVISESAVSIRQGAGAQKGRRVLFQFTKNTPFGPQPFLSEMLLFTHGTWFIKYRFTYLRVYKSFVSKEIDEFVEALAWPQ